VAQERGGAGQLDAAHAQRALVKVQVEHQRHVVVDLAMLRSHVAFYPQPLDCTVDGVPVTPQPGRFYAGWITPEAVGPLKGEAGSGSW